MATTFDDSRAVVIEFDTGNYPPNGSIHFPPTQEVYRGKFLFHREPEPRAIMSLRQKFGVEIFEIPAQKLGLDVASKAAFVDDPLHEKQHEMLAKSIKKLGFDLPPARHLMENVDVPTFVFWMKRCVEDGKARIVQGKLPDKIEGKPRTRFTFAEPVNGTANDLAALRGQLDARDREMSALREQLNALLAAALGSKAKG